MCCCVAGIVWGDKYCNAAVSSELFELSLESWIITGRAVYFNSISVIERGCAGDFINENKRKKIIFIWYECSFFVNQLWRDRFYSGSIFDNSTLDVGSSFSFVSSFVCNADKKTIRQAGKGGNIMHELKLMDVQKKYKDKEAVRKFNYTFINGVYGLLGENGAGKTTLMRLICGILKSTEGSIYCDDINIASLGAEYRKLLGYLPQDFGYYGEFTAERFLRLNLYGCLFYVI